MFSKGPHGCAGPGCLPVPEINHHHAICRLLAPEGYRLESAPARPHAPPLSSSHVLPAATPCPTMIQQNTTGSLAVEAPESLAPAAVPPTPAAPSPTHLVERPETEVYPVYMTRVDRSRVRRKIYRPPSAPTGLPQGSGVQRRHRNAETPVPGPGLGPAAVPRRPTSAPISSDPKAAPLRVRGGAANVYRPQSQAPHADGAHAAEAPRKSPRKAARPSTGCGLRSAVCGLS